MSFGVRELVFSFARPHDKHEMLPQFLTTTMGFFRTSFSTFRGIFASNLRRIGGVVGPALGSIHHPSGVIFGCFLAHQHEFHFFWLRFCVGRRILARFGEVRGFGPARKHAPSSRNAVISVFFDTKPQPMAPLSASTVKKVVKTAKSGAGGRAAAKKTKTAPSTARGVIKKIVKCKKSHHKVVEQAVLRAVKETIRMLLRRVPNSHRLFNKSVTPVCSYRPRNVLY